MQIQTHSNASSETSQSLEDIASSLQEMHPPTMFYVATVLGKQEWLDGENILVSAGTAWRNPGSSGAGEGFDIHVPETDCLFVDSGGFQAAVHYGNEYPYSPRELFEWAEEIGADYVAGMDWACEKEEALRDASMVSVTADDVATVPERIERSIDDQIRQAAVYEQNDWPFDFVPAVQGYSVSDYRYCARRLRQEGIARPYMSIGSVCKRDSPDQILRVLKACREELPHTEFHLFGATRRIWKDRRFWNRFVSADTHAWAASHPDGGWPANNTEKKEAFEHFHDDISSVQEKIEWTRPLEQSTNPLATVISESHIEECACGAKIPTYGTDFNPQCRHCERIELNRWAELTHALDTATVPTVDQANEFTQQQLSNSEIDTSRSIQS